MSRAYKLADVPHAVSDFAKRSMGKWALTIGECAHWQIPPTGKSFDVDFCTVGHWKNGQMVEEYLFYDVVTFMQQIGLSE